MSRKPRAPDNPVTPWAPSRRAVAQVKNPLPLPTTCRLCGAPCRVVPHTQVYNGKSFGKWPWVVLCLGCGAHVGLHPFTGIPLGTLALQPLRDARKAAKDVFNTLWFGEGAPLTRDQAYAWLAGKLGIEDVEQCHLGWFEEPQCQATVVAVRKYLEQ